MLKHYLVIAYRNLIRNKTISLIHIVGLSIGIAAFLIGIQNLLFEYSFDNFHEKKDQVYRVATYYFSADDNSHVGATAHPMADHIRANIPEMKYVARYIRQSLEEPYCVVSYTPPSGESRVFNELEARYVDPDFLRIFSFPILRGDTNDPLGTKTSIVLTQSTARKYFLEENPIGKTLEITTGGSESKQTRYTYQVTAVVADPPANSSIQFDLLLPYKTWIDNYETDISNLWGWFHAFQTFVVLEKDANPEQFTAQLNGFPPASWQEEMIYYGYHVTFRLQALEEIHFDLNNGDVGYNHHMILASQRYVHALGLISLVIMLLALINYVNLSTARSVKRAKEVGIKKAIGAARRDLIIQFMTETIVLNTVALIVAVTLVQLFKPWLPTLLDINSFVLDWSATQMLLLLCVLVLTSLAAGLFPALLLTKAMGMHAMKGRIATSGRGLALRRGLVLFQFLCSTGFIIFAFAVSGQMDFLASRDTGMELTQRIAIQSIGTEDFDFQKYRSFKNALRSNAHIGNISASSVRPGDIAGGNSGFSLDDAPEIEVVTRYCQVDYDYFTTMGIPIIAGEEFTHGKLYGLNGVGEESAVISEVLLSEFGFSSAEEALGRILRYNHVFGDVRLKIIGVAANVAEHFQGAIRQDRLYMFANTAHPFARYEHYLIGLEGDLSEGLKVVESEWRKAFPGATFEYTFMDEAYRSHLNDDLRIRDLSDLSSLLTIIIATLGLLGLVSFSTAQRTKEVGIRKTLGATTSHIVFLLSWDFLRIILLAVVIAIPMVWYAANEFLAGYEDRITLDYLLFVIPSLLLLGIALLAVSFQTIRTARSNPVDSLRYE